MPVLFLDCHLPHNTPHIPSRYNNEQTKKQTKALKKLIYIHISCKCDTNCAGHFTLDAYASRPVACIPPWVTPFKPWKRLNLSGLQFMTDSCSECCYPELYDWILKKIIDFFYTFCVLTFLHSNKLTIWRCNHIKYTAMEKYENDADLITIR